MRSLFCIAATLAVSFSCADSSEHDAKLAAWSYHTPPRAIIESVELNGRGYKEHFILGLAYKKEKKYKNAIFHFANSAFVYHRDTNLKLFPLPVYQFLNGFHIKSPYFDDAAYEIAKLFSHYGEHPYVVKITDLVSRSDTALYRDTILLRAHALSAIGRLDEARAALESLLSRFDDPESRAVIYLRLGSLLEKKGDIEAAQENLLKVLSAGVDTWQAASSVKRLASLMRTKPHAMNLEEMDRYAKALYYAGMYEEAVPLFEQAVKRGGHEADRYLVRSLVRSGRISEAEARIAASEKATSLTKTLGDELWDMNKKNQAVLAYRKVIDSGIEPEAQDALKRVARRLEEGKQHGYETFILMYRDRYTDDEAGHLIWLLARNLIRAHQDERAAQLLEESLAKFPRGGDSDKCRFWLYKIHSAAARHEQAHALARDMTEFNPDSPYTWRLLASIASSASEQEIEERYRNALAAQNRKDALLYHALLFIKQKSMDGRSKRLSEIDPPECRQYEDLARAVRRMDCSSSHAKRLKRIDKYFAVGHAAAVARELRLLPKTDEARRDRNIALAWYGNRYHIAYHQVNSVLELLKISGLRENLFCMPEELIRMLFPRPFEDCVAAVAKDYSLDPDAIYSLAKAESLFRHNAVSSAGAVGLMQLMPATARGIARSLKLETYDLRDPCTSIRLGSRYLSDLMRQFGGSFSYAVGAYNAGAANIIKWKNRMTNDDQDYFIEFTPFIETRYYILRTNKFLAQYQAVYSER